MGLTRKELHRLVDALPEERLDALGRRLVEDFGAMVAEALGAPGEPQVGQGDLDAELDKNPQFGRQLGRALDRLKRGELGVRHEEVERRLRG